MKGSTQNKVTNLLGEFECRIDPKGRVMMPAALKKQIPAAAKKRFVINRGFERCLVLYPMNEWEKESAEVNKLNLYIKANREFMRAFRNGATELMLDNTNRLLLPKTLLDYAGIDKDIVLFAFGNRIEVWAKAAYDKMMSEEPENYAALAEQVMGKKEEGN